MINIRTLGDVAFAKIHAAAMDAFSDYAEPFQKTEEELRYIVDRRGYNPHLSFGAFHNDTLASYTLNGIGEWGGLHTAYDTGTGTTKAYRKQGLAARVFEESLPVLKAQRIEQYLLEVIKVNSKAFDLYRKQGFEISRELDYYVTEINKIVINDSHLANGYLIKEIDMLDINWQLLSSFWDFQPSWQNSIDSIIRKCDFFTILGIYDGDTLAGYGIMETHSGDVPQFAIAKGYREKGLGIALFKELLSHSKTGLVRLINLDASYQPFKKFLSKMNIQPGYGQYEMMLKF